MINTIWIVGGLAAVLVAALIAWRTVRSRASELLADARSRADRTLEDARREGEARVREAELAAKEKLLQARSEFETASRKRRGELEGIEKRLLQKEESLDRRGEEQGSRDRDLAARDRDLGERDRRLAAREGELEGLLAEQRNRLEQIAGLTAQQAREELVRGLEDEARLEGARIVKRIEDEAREQGDRKAQWIMGLAVQRLASDYISETSVSVVELPSDEMKGRIIGREGRNIRALELATGIDLIVDDTPEAVILSGFDPFRREIARVALERLIADGRIHPARIEEIVNKTRAEFDQRIQQEGDAVLLELKIPGMHPELVKLLGRLRYRYSYGQNVLQHSKEVAFLSAAMAAELKVNTNVAKRAGLLHDIGKAIDREVDGTHLELGIELLRKHGESEEVVHAMACHHGDYDPQSVEAVLVTAADALSAARPGARREVLETYVKRLEKLEEIASGFKGVEKTFAIQAGREIRVIVDSGKLNDEQALWLSKDLARKIESELTYPGQIRVTVIREMRAVEYAK
ncbi:MAG: ribonuclease Y [Thermoanaerobaculia bacterium]|nr:MAG: ribonuclease Y [Thermoanaerobaculia bacterium]